VKRRHDLQGLRSANGQGHPLAGVAGLVPQTIPCQGAWMTILPSGPPALEEAPGGGGAGRSAFDSPVSLPVALPVCGPVTCWDVALTFGRIGRSGASRVSAGRAPVS